MRYLVIVIIVVIILFGSMQLFDFNKRGERVKPFVTELFIDKWLTNDNNTLATYINETPVEDEDLVKGREALSESLGLWMEYAILKEDKILFDESYTILNRYFLARNGFVHWKLTETGKSEVSTNALIDDLRIILALLQASEKWGNTTYEQTAERISKYIIKHNKYKDVLTDFYERKDKYANEVITLTYIDLDALQAMNFRGFIYHKTVHNMDRLIKNMPTEGAFFPKEYHVSENKYIFDAEINLIDQSLVALYRAKRGYSTTLFENFIRQQLATNNAIFGKYDLHTKDPLVDYESPAIYGWLIIYFLELNEIDIAETLFQKMKKHQKRNSKYYGGYAVYDNNTHIYDNLVPLLAEITLLQHD